MTWFVVAWEHSVVAADVTMRPQDPHLGPRVQILDHQVAAAAVGVVLGVGQVVVAVVVAAVLVVVVEPDLTKVYLSLS